MGNGTDDKKKFVLSVLSMFKDKYLSPVQIQKLFFLIQKRLNKGETFNFKPYHYGPYSSDLTKILVEGSNTNDLQEAYINGVKHYCVKEELFFTTDEAIFSDREQNFIKDLGDFVTKLNFKELCMAIYDEFPEMKQNSVFFNR